MKVNELPEVLKRHGLSAAIAVYLLFTQSNNYKELRAELSELHKFVQTKFTTQLQENTSVLTQAIEVIKNGK